jgi:oligosaccharide repeat unit polymerase
LVLLNSSTTKWARRTAYFFTIVLLPLALSTGFRSNVVKAIAPIVLAWYLQRQRRPSAKLCFVIALAAILIFASIGLVRSGQATFADAFTSAALFDRELLLSDLNTIQAMCMVIAKVPEQFDYLWGESIRYVPIHLLPRSLFPDKGVAPEVQLVWDATDRYAGFAIPIFGLFYLNFSYPGAFVGMALVGYFVSKVYHGFRKNPSLRRAQAYLMVIYLLAYLAFPRHSFVQTLTQVVYVFCPLLVLDLLEIAPATWCAWSNGPVYISRPARRVEVNS